MNILYNTLENLEFFFIFSVKLNTGSYQVFLKIKKLCSEPKTVLKQFISEHFLVFPNFQSTKICCAVHRNLTNEIASNKTDKHV